MKAKAAVAWEAQKPLSIEMIDVEGPKQGEVLLKVIASGVCHTDAFTLSETIRKACSRRCWGMRAAARWWSAAQALKP